MLPPPNQKDPWLTLRAAIFKQAVEDWNEQPEAAREYIITEYSHLDLTQRINARRLARHFGLPWQRAASIYEFFNNGDADLYLIDTQYTGADMWEMLLSGSWNRGGIKDKPYAKPVEITPPRNRTKAEIIKNLDYLFRR